MLNTKKTKQQILLKKRLDSHKKTDAIKEVLIEMDKARINEYNAKLIMETPTMYRKPIKVILNEEEGACDYDDESPLGIDAKCATKSLVVALWLKMLKEGTSVIEEIVVPVGGYGDATRQAIIDIANTVYAICITSILEYYAEGKRNIRLGFQDFCGSMLWED